MSGRQQLRTVVADTSALVSLAVPRAASEYNATAELDPLQFLLTCNVLAAQTHYTVEDPYDRTDAPDSRPAFGLDDGETDGIVLANTLGVDGFLTDEFGGTNFALIHAVLDGPRIIPTPRLICDYVRNDYMTRDAVRTLITTISPYRSWDNSPYVTQLLEKV